MRSVIINVEYHCSVCLLVCGCLLLIFIVAIVTVLCTSVSLGIHCSMTTSNSDTFFTSKIYLIFSFSIFLYCNYPLEKELFCEGIFISYFPVLY